MFNLFAKKMPITYSYDDVTLIPSYSQLNSRSEAFPDMKAFSLPIIASCMDTLGTVEMMKCCMANKIPFIACRTFKNAEEQFHHFFPNNTWFEYYNISMRKNVWFAVGSVPKYRQWIYWLFSHGVRQFCVDMAHGDSKACVDTIKYIKQLFKMSNQKQCVNSFYNGYQYQHIIAGNVATVNGFKRLQKAGANGVRVGIASGSICSTAIQTGFGVPILSNIIDMRRYKKKNTWLIADGGIKSTGDIAKAIYFGADFVMLGKMFASTDLAGGDCYNKNKKRLNKTDYKEDDIRSQFACIYPHQFEEKYKKAEQLDKKNNSLYKLTQMCKQNVVAYKQYHGLASRQARKNVLSYASVQGVSGLIKYTGTTEQFIHDTYLRLQASLSYGGSKNWDQFRKKVRFCKRSESGIILANTHLQFITDK